MIKGVKSLALFLPISYRGLINIFIKTHLQLERHQVILVGHAIAFAQDVIFISPSRYNVNKDSPLAVAIWNFRQEMAIEWTIIPRQGQASCSSFTEKRDKRNTARRVYDIITAICHLEILPSIRLILIPDNLRKMFVMHFHSLVGDPQSGSLHSQLVASSGATSLRSHALFEQLLAPYAALSLSLLRAACPLFFPIEILLARNSFIASRSHIENGWTL
jgi:hypothetical protein